MSAGFDHLCTSLLARVVLVRFGCIAAILAGHGSDCAGPSVAGTGQSFRSLRGWAAPVKLNRGTGLFALAGKLRRHGGLRGTGTQLLRRGQMPFRDRKNDVWGRRVLLRVTLGVRRIIKQKINDNIG